MDFGTLLHVAKKNANEKQPEVVSNCNSYSHSLYLCHSRDIQCKHCDDLPFQVRGYSTKFAPPKKETKDKKLSANIQKFLQKREQEEREKERQVREKREQLMAARDTKSRNKINKMLKVIKSANKSVLDDATDKDDTALTLAGPEQPDEDDYGYVSQESCALYKRLMDQYKTSPEEKKPSKSSNPRPLSGDNMKNTTNRVKEALTRERNEPNHRVRSEHKPSVSKSELPLPSVSFSVPEKPKPKRPPPPPPVDFNSLLKLAEKKQFEPIKVEQEIKKDERPMTMKEKREFEERRSLAEARKKRLDCVNYDYQKSGPVPAAAKASTGPTRIPKLGNATRPGAPKINPVKINPSLIPSRETKTPPTNTNQGPPKASAVIKQAKDRPPVYRATPKEVQPQERPKPQQEMPAKTRQFPPPDVQRTRQFPPPDVVRSRPFPPRDGRRPEMDRRPVKSEFLTVIRLTKISGLILIANHLYYLLYLLL